MDSEFLEELKNIENECSFELFITSGYRCETENRKVNGNINSRHLDGLAVDIRIYNHNNIDEIKALAKKSNYFTRVYDEGNHIHIGSGDSNFAFKELKDKYYNGDLRLTNSLYIGRGIKYNTGDFYRIGYFITDGYDLDNFYFYYEKLIKNYQYSLGGAWEIYFDPAYWGINLSAGKGKLDNIDYFFIEPSINIGYIFQYIDLQLNFGYTITIPKNFRQSPGDNISGFNLSIISSIGKFKS